MFYYNLEAVMIKKALSILTVLFLTSLNFGCGQYTNIPAQYRISSDSNLTATINYSTSGVTVTPAKLVLIGEPGSIGATFEKMSINYNTGEMSNLPAVPVSLRIDSSHFMETSAETGDVKVLTSKATLELPVVSDRVVELGKKQSVNNVHAVVSLTGTDDAGWPTSLDIGVSIVFIKGGGTTTTTPVGS